MQRREHRGRDDRGTTFLELVIVLAIIGILFAIAAPSMLSATKRTQDVEDQLRRQGAQVEAILAGLSDPVTGSATNLGCPDTPDATAAASVSDVAGC